MNASPHADEDTHDPPVAILAWMMFLIPALGVPSLLVLQDTLKSALAASGILLAALAFCWQRRRSPSNLQWHGLLWLPLALMVYALGSMAWSHPYLAGVETIRWFLLGLLLWLGLNTLTHRNVPLLVWGMHVGVTAASAWAALQFWADWQLFPQGPQPASTFINRNFFAEYAVCVLPASLWLLATRKPSRALVWMALSIGFNLVVLLMTGTRSALIALFVTVPILCGALWAFRSRFAFFDWPMRRRIEVVLTLVATVLVLGSIPTGNPYIAAERLGVTPLERGAKRTASVTAASEYSGGSISIRYQMWMATARMIQANPWTGVGAGAWEVQIPLYQRTDTVLETDYYAHNEYLQLLSEYGVVVGGLVLAVLLAYLLHSALATWRLRNQASVDAPTRVLALISLLPLVLVSGAGFPWHLAACGTLLVLCLSVLASSDVRLGPDGGFNVAVVQATPRFIRAMTGGLLACAALTIFIAVQAVRAESSLVEAMYQANRFLRSSQKDAATAAQYKSAALQDVREGIAINPHYRKLSAEIAEPFAASGDWPNAIWILESVAASRPHLAAIWSGLALGYSETGQQLKAQHALDEVRRLKPGALRTVTLEALMLSRSGQGQQAAQLLNRYFDEGTFDYDMLQEAFAIGFKTRQWELAVRSMELCMHRWPERAAESYFRLGQLYGSPAFNDEHKALTAFQAGLREVPPNERQNYLRQVPSPFRERM